MSSRRDLHVLTRLVGRLRWKTAAIRRCKPCSADADRHVQIPEWPVRRPEHYRSGVHGPPEQELWSNNQCLRQRALQIQPIGRRLEPPLLSSLPNPTFLHLLTSLTSPA